jgi:major membrane immunogen (membrane-anchored lipoprotein)
VLGGRIVSAHWTALPEEGNKDKYQASVDGDYGMVANSDAQSRWYKQADQAADRLIRTQDPAAVSVSSDGSTDAISGVSITVGSFYELAEEALEQGPEA